MFQSFRDGYANLITSGSYLLLLIVGIKTGRPSGWVFSLGMIAAVGFFAWIAAFRRSRVIADTPTSKIASAAQGYVEIYGSATRAPEYEVKAILASQPCIWFRCVTYRKVGDDKWQEISRETSDSLFELNDSTGKCMVDPEHAEVITTHKRTSYDGQYKYVEEQLFCSDNVYALGEFSTVGGANSTFDLNGDVNMLLTQWKQDKPALLKRFDLDGNGEIDLNEWQLARSAARREVEKQHRELRLQTGVHVMRQPASGQLFLLSNLSPQKLKLRYALWSFFHLAMFFGGVGGAVWVALRFTVHG